MTTLSDFTKEAWSYIDSRVNVKHVYRRRMALRAAFHSRVLLTLCVRSRAPTIVGACHSMRPRFAPVFCACARARQKRMLVHEIALCTC